MKSDLCLCAVLATLFATAAADAATLELVLLGPENQRLQHGEATVIASSPEEGWTRYVGYYRDDKYYAANLPNVDYLNVTIYLTADTSQKSIGGIYGRRNHTMYLRTDRVGYAACSQGETEWGMPFDLRALLDDLDAAFPNGVPRRMTNIRAQLQKTVIPALNNSPDPNDLNLLNEKREFRRRVMRHLR